MAVSSERKAKDMCRILVPSHLRRAWHDIFGIRKDLPNHVLVGAHTDPLFKVRGHMNYNTLTLRKTTSTFLPGPPVLQLNLEWSQLEEGSFFVQQRVFLQRPTKINYYNVSGQMKPDPAESKAFAQTMTSEKLYSVCCWACFPNSYLGRVGLTQVFALANNS